MTNINQPSVFPEFPLNWRMADLCDAFAEEIRRANFSAGMGSHARTVAKQLCQAAQPQGGPITTEDLTSHASASKAAATLRQSRSSDRRLPLLVRLVTFLRTGRLDPRPHDPEFEWLRYQCRPILKSMRLVRPVQFVQCSPPDDHPLAQAFIEEITARNQKWQKRAKYALRRFCQHVARSLPATPPGQGPAALDVRQIRQHHLRSFREELEARQRSGELKAQSASLTMQMLRSWFGFLYMQGYIHHDPSLGLPRRKSNRPTVARIITTAEAKRFFAVVVHNSKYPLRDVALFGCLCGLGLRPGEATGLRVGDLDPDRSVLRVLGKGNKERVLPLPAALRKMIDRYLASRPNALSSEPMWLADRGGPMSYSVLQRRFVRFRRDAEISLSVRGSHVFRHYFVTENMLAGADVAAVADFAGHVDIRTLSQYFHPPGRPDDSSEKEDNHDENT